MWQLIMISVTVIIRNIQYLLSAVEQTQVKNYPKLQEPINGTKRLEETAWLQNPQRTTSFVLYRDKVKRQIPKAKESCAWIDKGVLCKYQNTLSNIIVQWTWRTRSQQFPQVILESGPAQHQKLRAKEIFFNWWKTKRGRLVTASGP